MSFCSLTRTLSRLSWRTLFVSKFVPVVLLDALLPKDTRALYWLLSYTNGHTYPLLNKVGRLHSDLSFTDSGFTTVIAGAFYESAICKETEAYCYGPSELRVLDQRREELLLRMHHRLSECTSSPKGGTLEHAKKLVFVRFICLHHFCKS